MEIFNEQFSQLQSYTKCDSLNVCVPMEANKWTLLWYGHILLLSWIPISLAKNPFAALANN